MKIALLFLLTYFSSAHSAYVLERVTAIDGYVSELEFDSDGNAYVFSLTFTAYFHKLNVTKEIIWEINDDNLFIGGIHINSQNDVYLELTDISYIAILKEDTLILEPIAEYYFLTPIFLDEEGNIYYTGNNGINLLRPNSTTPILIKNLENYEQDFNEQNFAIDNLGNVYFAVYDSTHPDSNLQLSVLTKEEKEEEIPSADIFDLSSFIFMDCIVIDEGNNAWLFGTDFNNSYIKIISDNNLVDVRTDNYYRVEFAVAVEDQIYVEAIFPYENNSYAFFISTDGVIHKIPELENVPRTLFSFGTGVSDKEGNVYFGFYTTWDQGQILKVRPDANNTWIQLPVGVIVNILVLDENDDLWIGTNGRGFYILKKGETDPIQVSAPPEVDLNFRGIKLNKKTNEIYVLTTNDGLYYVKSDSD